MDPKLKRLDFKTLALSTSDFLMPRVCLCCGRQLLPYERHLCCVCLADFPLTHFEGQRVNPMADKLNSRIDAEGYLRAAALFYYSGDYKKITQALKYGRNFSAGRWFARLLGERLAAAGWCADLVCPVPLHWTRRIKRGYNQAEVIGRELARVLGVPFEPRLLRRGRRTGTQTRLSGEERVQNVTGAFCVNPVFRPSGKRPLFADGRANLGRPSGNTVLNTDGKLRVLLVDDVFTTGATLAACCRALQEAFGNGVEIAVATLAFVD